MTTLEKLGKLTNDININNTLQEQFVQYGYVVVNTLDEETGIPMIYTVGLTEKFNQPELAILGLEYKEGNNVINSIVADIDKGFSINHKTIYNGLLGKNYTCFFTDGNIGKFPVVTAIYGVTDISVMIPSDENYCLPGLDRDIDVESLSIDYRSLEPFLTKGEILNDTFVDDIIDVMDIHYEKEGDLVKMNMSLRPYEGQL